MHFLRPTVNNLALLALAATVVRLYPHADKKLGAPSVVSTLTSPTTRANLATFSKYTIQDLGTLPEGSTSAGMKANSTGQVVGIADDTNGLDHAFLWEDGKLRDLGSLGGKQSRAAAINDASQVVGTSLADNGQGFSWHPFIWKNGKMSDMLPNSEGNTFLTPLDINSQGQVTGFADIQLKGTRAVIWQRNNITDLGTLGGRDCIGRAINDKGQIAGSSQVAEGDAKQHAFLYDRTNGMKDLGTLGTGKESEAEALNNQGDVVGWSMTAEPADGAVSHAFVWSKGKMTDLGTLGGKNSSACSINDKGQIVGTSEDEESALRGFIWQGGQGVALDMLLPPNSGWRISPRQESPYSLGHLYINNQGQITGNAMHDGKMHAFLMTPRPN